MNFVSFLVILSAVCIYIQQRHEAKGDITDACSKNCKPFIEKTIHCNEDTGECAEGCITGFYGTTCNKACQCGGGPCELPDGTCIDVSTTVTPVSVSEGCVCRTEDYTGPVLPLVICCFCLLVILTILAIGYGQKKIIRMCKKEDQPLSQQGESDQLIDHKHLAISDASAKSMSRQVPASQKRRTPLEKFAAFQNELIDTLGIHCLNPEDTQPIILFCAHMKFDYERVNREKSHMKRGLILSNIPSRPLPDRFPLSFKKFHGTTSLSPIFNTECPTYFEVFVDVSLKNELRETELLLSIGLCREPHRDEWAQIRLDEHCFNLNVGLYSSRICTKIYREKDWEGFGFETNMANKIEESRYFHYGVLVYRGKRAIMYFDIGKMESLKCLEKVDFTKIDLEGPLWPMFGVYSGSKATVTMALKTGRDVKMTTEKNHLILSAVQAVKSFKDT